MLRDAARKEPVPADVNVRAACGGSPLGPHEGDEDPGLVVILPPQRKHTLRGDDAGGTVAWGRAGQLGLGLGLGLELGLGLGSGLGLGCSSTSTPSCVGVQPATFR